MFPGQRVNDYDVLLAEICVANMESHVLHRHGHVVLERHKHFEYAVAVPGGKSVGGCAHGKGKQVSGWRGMRGKADGGSG